MANKLITDIAKDFLGIVRKGRVGTVLPYEMATILNQATEEVVANKFKAIEVDKKAFNDLLPLKAVDKKVIDVSSDATKDTDDLFPNRYISLPEGFRRDIRLVVQFVGETSPTKLILLRSNETTDILNGVFSRPDRHQIYYTFFNKSSVAAIKLYTGEVAGNINYFLEYYKQPALITEASIVGTNITSEFGNEMVKEIVEMAALMYLERVQDARVQTFSNEINNK